MCRKTVHLVLSIHVIFVVMVDRVLKIELRKISHKIPESYHGIKYEHFVLQSF